MGYIEDYPKQYKDCAWLDFDTLERFMKDALMAYGVPEKDAEIVGDVLIESDKRGIDSHGIGRLKPIYLDRIDAGTQSPITKIDILKDEKAVAVLDGNNGMGHVVSHKAMSMAIDKAKEYGIGMTVVRHSTHYENMLGTNPLTFGMPTDEEFPFVLDCATSVSQRGKIEVYGRAGKDLPEGWVIDENGKTRTDTAQVLIDLTKGKAALTPLGGLGELTGGYKGFGYATVVEILSTALQDNDYMKMLNGVDENGKPKPILLGHFFIAIDPSKFMGVELFKKITGTILRELRASKKAPGQERIFTAGEKEYLAWQYRKEHGCPVPVSLQKNKSIGVSQSRRCAGKSQCGSD